MATILRRGQLVAVVRYALQYDWEGQPDCGFLFDCDENGNVNVQEMAEPAQESYRKCVTNTHDRKVIFRGVRKFHSKYHQPTLIRCDCGEELELFDAMTNSCDCGRLYNGAGQQLAHPSQWGEETGERFDDFGQPIL